MGNYILPGLRLSVTADRPFTTFKANTFTPELSDSEGWDTEVYPLTSTYTFGLRIDFRNNTLKDISYDESFSETIDIYNVCSDDVFNHIV